MKDFIMAANRIRYRIDMYKAKLSKNEMLTRYALVDPLLRELGWTMDDPEDVIPEDTTKPGGGRTDYTLGKNVMIVEVKKLGENLVDKFTSQVISYVKNKNGVYGVLTNGQKWKMYDVGATSKTPSVEFDITDPDWVVLPQAIYLHRLVVLGSISDDPPTNEPGNPWGKVQSETELPTKSIPGLTLPTIKYTKEHRPPKWLINKKTGDRRQLGSWVDILVGVADWLIRNGHLTTQDCPIPIGPKNYLVHTEPIHPNGKYFPKHRQIGEFYVYTNVSPANAIKYSINLITQADLNSSDFKIGF